MEENNTYNTFRFGLRIDHGLKRRIYLSFKNMAEKPWYVLSREEKQWFVELIHNIR